MIRLVVVIILLLIPATDLLTPGLCPEELQGMPMLAMVTKSCASQNLPSTMLADEHQRPPWPETPLKDECFCCCHHVVPQLIFVFPDEEGSVKVPVERSDDAMSPTGDPPYHPPRFS